MKAYPSIAYWNKGFFGEYAYSFDKLDGSNMRFEWSKKKGWYKFGTRRSMIDESHEQFGDAVTIFKNKYAEDLERIFKDSKDYRNTDQFVVFCEYLGENSFAGQHSEEDEKDLILFDVSAYKRGLIVPKEFINNFGHLHIPEVVYQGEYTEEYVEEVRNSAKGEGVVIKGSRKTKGKDLPWMVKIKTRSWLDRLKEEQGEAEMMKDLNGDVSLI